jgi:hypothetical protein
MAKENKLSVEIRESTGKSAAKKKCLQLAGFHPLYMALKKSL